MGALGTLLQALVSDPARLGTMRARQREIILPQYAQPAVAAKWAGAFTRQLGGAQP